jgi:hypothetical protein
MGKRMDVKSLGLAMLIAVSPIAGAAQQPARQPTQAQVRQDLAGAPGPMPPDKAVLDGYVPKQDWADLNKRLQSTSALEAAIQDLDWEKAQVVNGGNVLLAMHYVNTLWNVGNSLPSGPSEEMKQTAVAFALYDFSIAELDGLRCKDPSAVSRQLQQFASMWGPIVQYGRTSLSQQQQQVAMMVAVKLEWATAPVRANDPVLCNGGPQVAAHTPEFLPETQWKADTERRRANLPNEIDSVFKVSGGGAPPPAAAGK